MKDLLHIIFSAIEHSQKLHKLELISGDCEAMDIVTALKSELEEIQDKTKLLIKENAVQKKEIQQFMANIAGKHGLDVKYNVYYTPDGDGPFCPFCYENRSKKIRLRRDKSGDDLTVLHACRVCEQSFNDAPE